MDFPFLEYLLDLVSENSTICNLASNETNFIPPCRNAEQLLQIDVKYVFDYWYILIYTYISLFKVDKNHNNLLTNKYRLKFYKNFYHKKLHMPYIGDKSFKQVTRAIVTIP